MIVVTGARRSGTSAWMQILEAAGFPVLATRHPEPFAVLKSANPYGFYESRFRGGLNPTNNPDPVTGHYLHPEDTRLHAVKIFVPGLIRTEHAFLYRVIGTLRHWREQARSAELLDALDPARPVPKLPGPVLWWFDLFELLRDAGTRRYPLHLLTYDRLLRDPGAEIGRVLGWIGEGDLDAALSAVRPELRHHHRPEVDLSWAPEPGLPALFDEVFEAVDGPGLIPVGLIGRMNAAHAALRARFPRAEPPGEERRGAQ